MIVWRLRLAHDLMLLWTRDLNGKAPKMVMRAETADTSAFAEFSWCQWVHRFDNTASFPDDKWKMGRHCGPSFDIGPALSAKAIKENGQCHCLSALWGLATAKLSDPEVKKQMKEFDVNIKKVLGSSAKTEDLADDVEIALQHQSMNCMHEDDDGSGLLHLCPIEMTWARKPATTALAGAGLQLVRGDQ